MIPYIALLVVLPFGPTGGRRSNLDVGIFFVMAMSSVSVIGVLMAGWATPNKFSLIGALRAAAQLIAYELPLVLAAAAVVMCGHAVDGRHRRGAAALVVVIPQLPGFLIFLIASARRAERPPFDMPIADSEIIFGAYTEYTGLKFAFFLLAEYGASWPCRALAALFLGGYRRRAPFARTRPGCGVRQDRRAIAFFIIWLRATYPRLREDQLQRFAWLALIPISLVASSWSRP